MKQLIFMILMTLAGTLGVVAISPFWGVAVYYTFAVLRPQYLWEWSLPRGVSWSFYVALATLLAALAVAGGMGRTGNIGRAGPRWTFAHNAVLLFGAWVGISFVMARNHDAAYPWMIEYVKIFLMFAASAVLMGTVRQIWILLCLTALSLGYIAYEVNFLYLTAHYLGIWHNGYGGLDNNGAGLMLAMGVPLCYFAWEGGQRWFRWGFLLLVPVLLHAVLMTYSRGAMVSLIATTPLVLARSRHRTIGFAATLLLVLLLPFLAGKEIRARFLSTSQYKQDDSAQSRLGSWEAAWRMTLDNPIFGVGVRNANLFSHHYGADIQGRTIHNQYLQTSADTGLVGLGLYLVALAAVWNGLRKVRRTVAIRHDWEARRIRAIANGVECSFAVFCVGGTFLSLDVFELPYLLLLLGAQLPPLVCGSMESAVAWSNFNLTTAPTA